MTLLEKEKIELFSDLAVIKNEIHNISKNLDNKPCDQHDKEIKNLGKRLSDARYSLVWRMVSIFNMFAVLILIVIGYLINK